MNPFERIYTKGKLNYSYTVSEILGADGLCFNAGRKMLEFGNDVFTSCLVKLSLQDLSNCSNIRCVVSPYGDIPTLQGREIIIIVYMLLPIIFFLSWTSLTIKFGTLKYPRVCCWCNQFNSDYSVKVIPERNWKSCKQEFDQKEVILNWRIGQKIN